MQSLFKLTVLCVVCGLAFANEDFDIIDSIRSEAPCSREGGVCTIATDCTGGQLVKQRGLCPKQQNRGVECCYGPSVKETRCQKLGGGCLNQCPDITRSKKATDCPKSTFCCILV